MITSTASVRTENASKYLMQLSKHWKHKFPDLTYDTHHADIPFPAGRCILDADAGALEIALEAETEEGRDKLQQVVADHLKRFAFREQLAFAWTRNGT